MPISIDTPNSSHLFPLPKMDSYDLTIAINRLVNQIARQTAQEILQRQSPERLRYIESIFERIKASYKNKGELRIAKAIKALSLDIDNPEKLIEAQKHLDISTLKVYLKLETELPNEISNLLAIYFSKGFTSEVKFFKTNKFYQPLSINGRVILKKIIHSTMRALNIKKEEYSLEDYTRLIEKIASGTHHILLKKQYPWVYTSPYILILKEELLLAIMPNSNAVRGGISLADQILRQAIRSNCLNRKSIGSLELNIAKALIRARHRALI